jgi:hypothetical protein
VHHRRPQIFLLESPNQLRVIHIVAEGHLLNILVLVVFSPVLHY